MLIKGRVFPLVSWAHSMTTTKFSLILLTSDVAWLSPSVPGIRDFFLGMQLHHWSFQFVDDFSQAFKTNYSLTMKLGCHSSIKIGNYLRLESKIIALKRNILSNSDQRMSYRSSLHAVLKSALWKMPVRGFFLVLSHRSSMFLNFYSIFTMKAVAKLRDHNYERESPKTKKYFLSIVEKCFHFTSKTHYSETKSLKIESNGLRRTNFRSKFIAQDDNNNNL